MAISVEDARTFLRAEVEASSLNAVAERIGIDRSTLRTFIMPGGVRKPIARVLEPILAYVAQRMGSSRNGEPDGGASPEGPGALSSARPRDGMYLLPGEKLAEWRGELRAVLRFAKGLVDSVQVVHDQLGEVTASVAGVAGFLDTGVPAPGGALPPGWHHGTRPTQEEIDSAREELDQWEKELAAEESGGQSRKRRGSRNGAT